MRTRGHVTCGCVLPVVATQRALPYGAAASRKSTTPRHLLLGKRNFSSEGSKSANNSSANEVPGHNRWLSTPRVALASAVLGAAGVAWISGRGGKEDTTSSPPKPSVEASIAAFPAEPLERTATTSSHDDDGESASSELPHTPTDDDGESASSELPHTPTESKSRLSVSSDVDETSAKEDEPVVATEPVATEPDANEEEEEGAKLTSTTDETPLPQGEGDNSRGESDAKGADANDQEELVVDVGSGEGVEGDEGSAKGSVKVDARSISEQSEGRNLSDGSDQIQGDDRTARSEEEALGESSGASEGKQSEETGSAQSKEEEEEEECGFCVFLKAGPCGTEFEEWQKCVDDTQKQGKDIVMECLEKTRVLKECMESHVEYYGEILALEKNDEAQEKDSSKQSEQSEVQDDDSSRQSEQSEQAGGRFSEEKAPSSAAEPEGKAGDEEGDDTIRKENKGGDAERDDKGAVGEGAGTEGASGGRAIEEETEKTEKLPEEADSDKDGESSAKGDGGDDTETGAGGMSTVRCVGDKCEFVRRRVLRKKSAVDASSIAANSSTDEGIGKVPVEEASKD
ncbi:hypothetical protein CBR_g26201 [Chara braunii]|uniref:GCK domain-containing protein n=1 Tax=Chara braunii TaxID=69332 RepID=A0A388L7B3_CHABU|nr:hypothetical protein CBR_g26201 [Chara braunii]|eukprot:GBG78168.1 hypothetical protein CBR_g26201 [Chara braunii]